MSAIAITPRRLAAVLGTGLVLTAGAAVPAGAQQALISPQQASTPQNTIHIDNCKVRKSYHQSFVYAYCAIVTDVAAGQKGSVQWKANMKTSQPKGETGITFQNQTGTYKFGAGSEVWNVGFAFQGKTVAQVEKSLRVTLSNAKNATIVDGTATAVAATSS
ncbi:MAG: hypothetical protein JHC95_05930 [Solirubrobacteraceae bacterium]|nr:hypothetical protein [Solirubrobacteraceae bacterium]